VKLTKNQQKELVVWKYYITTETHWDKENDSDIVKFFEWSERGLHKEEASYNQHNEKGKTYFHALIWGKTWADRHIKMYQEGVLEGYMPYITILGLEDGETTVPKEVMEYISKNMFQGCERKLIQECYDSFQ